MTLRIKPKYLNDILVWRDISEIMRRGGYIFTIKIRETMDGMFECIKITGDTTNGSRVLSHMVSDISNRDRFNRFKLEEICLGDVKLIDKDRYDQQKVINLLFKEYEMLIKNKDSIVNDTEYTTEYIIQYLDNMFFKDFNKELLENLSGIE